MRTESTFDRITQAYVRKPGKNFAEGISPAVGIPDYERALHQHQKYIEALQSCGVDVSIIRNDTLFPDGVFLNDLAVVTEQMAVLANFPDQSPRQGEQQAAASVLGAARFVKHITSPGRLDAGDVLQVRDNFYIGLSDHTNQSGAEQLRAHLAEFGYQATILDLASENIVRLSVAAVYIGRDRLIIREELARHYAFLEYDKIVVSREERGAANAVMVNGKLLMPAGYPRVAGEVRDFGLEVVEVDVTEFEKMNGGLCCMAMRLPHIDKGNVVLMPTFGKRVA